MQQENCDIFPRFIENPIIASFDDLIIIVLVTHTLEVCDR